MKVVIVTLFPEYYKGPLDAGILGKARASGLVHVELSDLRGFGEGRHRVTDDYPYGGGAGMVMKPGPVVAAVEAARDACERAKVVLLTPQGRSFSQPVARDLAVACNTETLILVCGRYEGFDERIRSFCDVEISVGDFVLMGGEAASLVVLEAVARLRPGVLGDSESPLEESLSDGLLEYPQYTRPREFRGMRVPAILLEGNHAAIAAWRREQSVLRTAGRRPDLLERASLTTEERRLVAGGRSEE